MGGLSLSLGTQHEPELLSNGRPIQLALLSAKRALEGLESPFAEQQVGYTASFTFSPKTQLLSNGPQTHWAMHSSAKAEQSIPLSHFHPSPPPFDCSALRAFIQ